MTAPLPNSDRATVTAPTREFTYRSARSGSLLAGLALAILVETVALHLWLVERSPTVAWVLMAISLASLGWLIADYRAIGRGAVRLTRESVDVVIGRRFAITLSRADVASVDPVGWRDVPEPGTAAASGYLNLTAPAEPNVIVTLATPTRVRLTAGISREVRRLGLHLDDRPSFLAAMKDDAASGPAPQRASPPR